MGVPLSRSEFEEIAAVYRRQGAKFSYYWVQDRPDPVLVFESVNDDDKLALEAVALLVLPED